MKRTKLLYLALFFWAMSAQAQDLKIHVNKKGKVGFVDANGNEIIRCQYESARPFNDGIAIVTKSNLSGIIDTSGKVLLPLKYDVIHRWNDHLFLLKSGKKYGIADNKGTIVLPVSYTNISKLNCFGKALIASGGSLMTVDKNKYMANAKYGIIDQNGKILVKPQYQGLYEFSFDASNITPYYKGKRLEYSCHYISDTLKTDCSYVGFSGNSQNIFKAGILDANGKEVLKANLYDIVMYPQNGMVRYYVTNTKKKQTSCGYHNLNTNKSFQAAKFDLEIDSIKFWSHGDFIGDITVVNGSSFSFIDKEGKVVRSGFESVKRSNYGGLWAAKNANGKWDVFDDKNNDVSKLSGFDDINLPVFKDDKEIYSVKKDGTYGCISKDGNVIVPFEYDFVGANYYNFFHVTKNGKTGMITVDNKIVVPIEFAFVGLPPEPNAEHFWVKKSDNLFYHVNSVSKQLSSIGYKDVSNFKDGMAYVRPVNMKVEDTQVNRAQLFVPNTPKKAIDALDMSKQDLAFYNIINTKDELLFDLPLSLLTIDKVKDELVKRGCRKLTANEQKNILLDITSSNRSFDIKSVLNEDEWNY